MTPSITSFVSLIHTLENLKTIKRTGWVRAGINQPESVADHSFRMALLALFLAPRYNLNVDKAVQMALIHDLAEALVGDLVPGEKTVAEKHLLEEHALGTLLESLPQKEMLIALWKEMEEGVSKEAVFVKRLDKLEMLFQAKEYEQSQPDVDLSDFWKKLNGSDFGELELIFNELKK